MITAIKERPIIFSGENPRHILSGLKTQTRRVVKPQPTLDHLVCMPLSTELVGVGDPNKGWKTCPYGKPGERLWVKEKWAINCFTAMSECTDPGDCHYAATCNKARLVSEKWRSPMFMPRWASRITLEITEVRVERLQAITQVDAKAEGVESDSIELQDGGPEWSQPAVWADDYVGPFAKLWDSINADRGHSWESNPFCWVLSFRLVKRGDE